MTAAGTQRQEPSAALGWAASSRALYKYILYIMQRKVNGFTAIFIKK